MIRFVIAADGEHRSIAPDYTVSAFKSLELGALDIHFDKRDAFPGKGIVQTDATNLSTRSDGDATSADAVSRETDNTVVGAYRSIVKYRTGANTIHVSLKAGYDRRVGLESDHLAKAITGLGNEGLDRVSGVGAAIDEALVGAQREEAGEVLVARNNRNWSCAAKNWREESSFSNSKAVAISWLC
jgi:hypothetical protein